MHLISLWGVACFLVELMLHLNMSGFLFLEKETSVHIKQQMQNLIE